MPINPNATGRNPIEPRGLLPVEARNWPSERLIFAFGCALQGELEFRKSLGLDDRLLKIYYRNLIFPDGRLSLIGLSGYAARLSPVLAELRRLPPSASLLDAGCGYGSESLIFSLFGQEVTGVELVPERVQLASSRQKYYEGVAGRRLNLHFENAHVLRFLERSASFDLIWAMEAISHIHPPEAFFSLAFRRLKSPGMLIISDPNSLSPLAWLRSLLIRGSVRHRTHSRFVDPESGRPVEYGQEKIFAVFSLKKRLAGVGFRIQKIQMSGFLGSSFLPHFLADKKPVKIFLTALQRQLQRMPGIRDFGSLYTIVATKK